MAYGLKVRVDVNDTYEEVHNLFKYQSVRAMFFHSWIPPHQMEYHIGPLSDVGVENWKKKFDSIVGCKYSAEVFQYDPD